MTWRNVAHAPSYEVPSIHEWSSGASPTHDTVHSVDTIHNQSSFYIVVTGGQPSTACCPARPALPV